MHQVTERRKMSGELLKGKPIADKIKEDLKGQIASFKKKPKLLALQIGENPASQVYTRNQMKQAELLGIEYELKALSATTSQSDTEALIRDLNKTGDITAVIVQLPVPKQIDPKMLVNLIDPMKDAEGMHPANLGKILLGSYSIGPCTAMAVMELLQASGTELYGKVAVCVGHSEIVGKPLSLMLLNKFATTSVCHIATGERGMLAEYVKRAEVLIVAVGKAGIVKGEWIKDGAIVIDVGINRVEGKLVGDVEFETASKHASLITPVPGGVGPLTTTILMRNVVELHKLQTKT